MPYYTRGAQQRKPYRPHRSSESRSRDSWGRRVSSSGSRPPSPRAARRPTSIGETLESASATIRRIDTSSRPRARNIRPTARIGVLHRGIGRTIFGRARPHRQSSRGTRRGDLGSSSAGAEVARPAGRCCRRLGIGRWAHVGGTFAPRGCWPRRRSHVFATGDVLLALGFGDDRTAAWISGDGISWGARAVLPPVDVTRVVAGNPNHVVIIGRDRSGSGVLVRASLAD
jgi:hypothetical protein